MKVAIDAMGGDYPENNIKGAIKSLDDPEIEIFLVGEPEKLTKNLGNSLPTLRIWARQLSGSA